MPIGHFEGEVLRTIAANRNPDSYIAGATVLHQAADSVRSSRDVDVFHDTLESLGRSVEGDIASLRTAGFVVELTPILETIQRAQVVRGEHSTRIEWVYDSAFRFFPVEPDPELGWRINFWDAATNKVLALFGRHEFRDFIDVYFLHKNHLCLGALIWAAAGKDPGLTPELILDWISRSGLHNPEEIKQVALSARLDLRQIKRDWLNICEETKQFISKLPPQEMGCLYLDRLNKPVCPDPHHADFATLKRHFGSVKGAWPQIVA
jgi:hypothetical protein